MHLGSSLDFPFGDAGRFIIEDWLKQEQQVPFIQSIFGFDRNRATEAYENGVAIFNKSLVKDDPFNYHFIKDRWYNRKIFMGFPKVHNLLLMNYPKVHSVVPRGFPNVHTVADVERLDLLEIRQKLSKLSDSKERVLDFSIPIWYPKSQEELNLLISKINHDLQETQSGQHALWFRGQPKEYYLKRNAGISDWLGYNNDKKGDISLLPSLSRLALNDEKFSSVKWAWGATMHWEWAFILWVLINNPDWYQHKDGFENKLTEVLLNEDPKQFGELMFCIQHDPLIVMKQMILGNGFRCIINMILYL